jgi:hypothetical protein
MRGKSIDTEYVAAFIQKCAAVNKTSPEEICDEVLSKIEEIDKQLKIRLKLVDVLSFFNYKKKAPIIERDEIDFDLISDFAASEIIGIVSNDNCINIENLMSKFSIYSDEQRKELIFTLKQMLEAKIIFRSSDGFLTQGSNFRPFNEAKIYKK